MAPTALRAVTAGLLLIGAPALGGSGSFVNWESPHGTPLDLTPDGSTLLAVNTPDNRLEVFAVNGASLASIGSVPVGLDPVSVRARSDTEAWVVNHVSDTVSIVDLAAMNVVRTLHPGDEPVDVVFAQDRAFVSVSQRNQVVVYDLADLSATTIDIEGEDPRVLATDGSNVYAAIFESGNGTTVLGQAVVSSTANPYSGDPNPPPNAGAAFDPPIAGDLPAPPAVSLIVRKDGGAWLDDNGTDWSGAVTWDLHDHDVAIIDAGDLSVSYATGLMNLNMAVGARPGGGVTVVGTDAINEVRFEPNVQGVFVQVVGANVSGAGAATAIDLNPHLDYSTPTAGQSVRDQSIGDPRGVAWTPDGGTALITGMGSNNVAVVDAALGRVDLVEVGQGPTGIVVDAAGGLAYVMNKFEASISIIDLGGPVESGVVSFYDPTPAAITDGRPFLYDTHRTSGLGQAACASCHVDGRMDQAAWDLGDPQGVVKDFNQVCNFGLGGCEDWHPMKGPMTTQTLIGIIGTEPFHWRGDREGLAAFNGAFESLLGDDTQLTGSEMGQFEAFVATLATMPNPNRNLDNSLPASFDNGGNPQTGQVLFTSGNLDLVNCADCHAFPSGTNGQLTSANLLQETQSIKIPQLRNMHEKTGFEDASSSNNRGFGYTHDGSIDTLFEFLNFNGFQFNNDQQRLDVAAFLMCFATDTHAGVGAQATVPASAGAGGETPSAGTLVQIASGGQVGLVVKGVAGGLPRGWYLDGNGQYQSDRAAEVLDEQALFALAGPGTELTFTLVPAGTEVRIGVDRDEDGFFDLDELDAGSNPADPGSTPDNVVPGDVDGDGQVGITDFLAVLGSWGPCPDPCPPACPADLDDDCVVGINDFLLVLGNWTG